MLNDFNCSCPVYIACGYTDLRRGIDGLASMVSTQFQVDPFQTVYAAPKVRDDRVVWCMANAEMVHRFR